MKLSPAWNDASRGKSAKRVLAASTRMSIVRGLERVEERRGRAAPLPKTSLADLGDHRRRAVLERRHVHVRGEHRQAEEHHAEHACP